MATTWSLLIPKNTTMKTIENALVASAPVPHTECTDHPATAFIAENKANIMSALKAVKAPVAVPSTINKWLSLGGLTQAEAASLTAAGFKPKPRSNIGEWSKVFDAKDRDRKVDIFKLGQLFIASSRNAPGFRGRDIVSSDDLVAVIAAVNAEFSPASALVR